MLTYGKSNGWLDNQPAALTRAYGKGRITYIAAVLDEKLMGTMAAWMTRESGVQPAFGPVPDGVEVSRRSGAGKDVFILLNASQEPKEVTLPHSMKLLLAGKVGASLTLEPYGVELLTNGK